MGKNIIAMTIISTSRLARDQTITALSLMTAQATTHKEEYRAALATWRALTLQADANQIGHIIDAKLGHKTSPAPLHAR